MGATKRRVPLNVAHAVLIGFGIRHRTRAYERCLRNEGSSSAGFSLNDFNEVLFDSPFVFIIERKDWLQEKLQAIAAVLKELEIELELHLEPGGDAGFVVCGSDVAPVQYRPRVQPHFDEVIRAIQNVVPADIEFRVLSESHPSDAWVYAVLPRTKWVELEHAAPEVIHHFFPRDGLKATT
jgi:hypothetical protein